MIGMLDVAKCFDERQLGGFNGQRDELLEYLLDTGAEEIYFLGTVGLYGNPRFRKLLADGWNTSCVLDMGCPYTQTKIRFAIHGLTRKSVKNVKIANWHGALRSEDGTAFSSEYKRYWSQCEAFVNGKDTPADDEAAEFVSISSRQIDCRKLAPAYYNAKNRSLRNKLKKEETVALNEVATILVPRVDKERASDAPVLQIADMRYPFNKDALRKRNPTDVVLKKGDVVIAATGNFKVFVYPGGYKAYAGPTQYVVRPNANITSEYLYLYLTTELAKDIFAALGEGYAFKRLKLQDVKAFPILVPKQDDAFYSEQFKKLTVPEKRTYLSMAELESGHVNEVEEILDRELIGKVKAYDSQQLRDLMEADIDELNICYAHGAYKAAIILAGSSLEAFLIDWLSAIEGKDYFVEQYYVYDKVKKYRRKATLADYIDAIEYIERPKWLDEAKIAHKIRQKRNLVHAKVVVEYGAADKSSAFEVIDYLKRIIKTRIAL